MLVITDIILIWYKAQNLAKHRKELFNRRGLPAKMTLCLQFRDWCPTQVLLSKEICWAVFLGPGLQAFFLHLHFAFKNTVGDNVILFKTIELPEFVKPKRDILRICFLYSLGSQRESFIDIERIFWPFAFSLASLILAFP